MSAKSKKKSQILQQTTYIFNNAEELKQQELNLHNIGQNIPPRQSFGKAGAKLAALSSKYEHVDLSNIQMNKINSDHNLHINKQRDHLYTEKDIQFSNIKEPEKQTLKQLKINAHKLSSHSMQVGHRNKISSRLDSGSKGMHQLSYESQVPYSAYDHQG